MTIDEVKTVRDPHTDNYTNKTDGEDQVGGHATEPEADDNAKDAARKAGVVDTSEKKAEQ